MPEQMPGIKYALHPLRHRNQPQIVKAVKEVAKVPVIAKLMVPWEDAGATSKKLVEAGADALTGMGTFAFRALDIDVDQQKIYLCPPPMDWAAPG